MAAAAETDLAQFTWKSRVLLVFAPADDDPDLLLQRSELAAAKTGVAERDLAVVEIVGTAEPGLRRRFHVPQSAFAAILLGKDGGEKQRSSTPAPPDQVFATIDRMPMRRSEARLRD